MEERFLISRRLCGSRGGGDGEGWGAGCGDDGDGNGDGDGDREGAEEVGIGGGVDCFAEDGLGIGGGCGGGGEAVGAGVVDVRMSGSEEDEGKVSWMKEEADEEGDGDETGESRIEDRWFGVAAGGGGGCGGGREGSVLLGKSVVRRPRSRGGMTVLGSRKWVVRVWERNLRSTDVLVCKSPSKVVVPQNSNQEAP